MSVVRPATPEDAAAVARIYNAGIEGREATFETRLRGPEDVLLWLGEDQLVLVAEGDDGALAGFARVIRASARPVYAGVGDHGVYVDPAARGRGVGRALLTALAAAAEQRGFYKLTSRIFTTNAASLALHRACGFEEVGVQRRHGQLDGVWKDCMVVDLLLGEAAVASGA